MGPIRSSSSARKAKRNWDRLTIQLVLFFVIPLTLILSALAFLAVNWHESAMRDLILVRDEGATQLAAGNLNAGLNRYQRDLDEVQSLMVSGLSLKAIQETRLDLVAAFDRGLAIVEGEDVGAAEVSQSRCGSSSLDTFALVSTATDPTLAGCVSFNALDVAGVLTGLQMERAASVFLLDDASVIRYSLTSKHIHRLDYALLDQAGSQAQDRQSVATIVQDETIVTYSSIGRLGWRLVMIEPWHDITNSQLQQTLIAPLFVVPITLLSVSMLGFGSLRVVRPLQRLRQIAAELSNGDLTELSQPVGGIQEIEDLQMTLVDMTGELRKAQATLREYIGAITRAQEEERSRLARELHDDTVQALIALNQRVQMVQRTMSRKPAQAEQRLGELRAMVDQAIVDVRHLIHAMRPTYLADLGLVAAISTLAQDVRSATLDTRFELEGEPHRLGDELELAFYRVAQEAISNVLRHAQASNLLVRLTFEDTRVRLLIQDDGRGFAVPPNLLDMVHSGNYGLAGMSERTQLVHGDLTIVSEEASGTTLTMCAPVASGGTNPAP